MKSSLVVICAVAFFAQGCSVYRPKSAIPSSYTNQVLADVGSPDLLKTYNLLPQKSDDDKAAKIARRNQILTELIYLVDQNYYKFENHFYGSQATFSTGGDAINLGLTAAASVTGTAELKSILSATATGTTGLTTSIEKNFFDQQSRAAVVTQMRALRSSQLALMQDGDHMKAGITVSNAGDKTYSLETGIADVNTYYDAGTVVGALQAIAQAAGAKSTDAEGKGKTNSATPQAIN